MNLPTLAGLEQIARQAGQILNDGYEKEHQVHYKGEIDLVTEVDHASEKYLISEIQRLFPTHRILSEEAGALDGHDEHLWIVDPLDGTVNYAHGIPFFSVSLAYAYKGIVKLGAVYDPLRDEMFIAERGNGAWLRGRALIVSNAEQLQNSLLETGFPYDVRTTENNNLDNYGHFALSSRGVRRLGSAALDLCYVAAGRFDGYWELSVKPWDVAAGGLIAEEAGARVTNAGGDVNYLNPPCSIIAASPGIYEKLLSGIKS
jgi:myo-inositol-1(or 4)-monophosphatase